jgi:hypothetical protein
VDERQDKVGPEFRSLIEKRIRTLQIVVLALAAGVVSFLVIAVIVRVTREPDQLAGLPVLTYVLLALAIVTLVFSLVFPERLFVRQRRKIAAGSWQPVLEGQETPQVATELLQAGDAGKLYLLFNQRTVITAGMREGAGFLATIAFFLEGQVVALVVGVLVAVLVLMLFPTSNRVHHWIEQQLQLLDRDRRLLRK